MAFYFLRLSSGKSDQGHKSDSPSHPRSKVKCLSRSSRRTRLKRGLFPNSKRGQSIFTGDLQQFYMLGLGKVRKAGGHPIQNRCCYPDLSLSIHCYQLISSAAQLSPLIVCLGRLFR